MNKTQSNSAGSFVAGVLAVLLFGAAVGAVSGRNTDDRSGASHVPSTQDFVPRTTVATRAALPAAPMAARRAQENVAPLANQTIHLAAGQQPSPVQPSVAVLAPIAADAPASPGLAARPGRVNISAPRPRSTAKSVAIVAGSAGAGAAIGGVAAGKKGAAVGAISGGVAGFIYDRLTAQKK